jgi:integrase
LREELLRLWEGRKGAGQSIFGVSTNVKRSFDTACKKAEIEDLHFHDLRHTFCTRLIEKGVPVGFVARVAGHSRITTTYRYINQTEDGIRLIEAALNHEPKKNGPIE